MLEKILIIVVSVCARASFFIFGLQYSELKHHIKMSEQQSQEYDWNQNCVRKHTASGYTSSSGRISIPQNLLAVLKEAALNCEMKPIAPRVEHSLVDSSDHVKQPVHFSLDPFQRIPMAEKRKMLLKTNKPASNGKCSPNSEVYIPEKNNNSVISPKSGKMESALSPKEEKVEPQKEKINASPPFEKQHKVSSVGVSNCNLPNSSRCCCHRPKKLVVCRFCGSHVKGNVKKICPEHPQYRLYELDVCWNADCRAPGLLQEYDF